MNLALSVPDWQPAGRPVLLPPRPAELVGREDQLDVLRDRLTEPHGPWPRIAVLHGLGGTGKTSLAAEYAHRHQAGFGIIWHLAAEDRTGMETGFARLGALLGVAGRVLDSRDPVASVYTVLADSGLPWLLIFDNAPDPASVRDFLPRAGRGQILITSQHGLWPPGQGIEIGALDVTVAADFLASQTGDPDRAAARDLAAALGGLPLALAHAAAYTVAAIGSLAGYLELFGQRRAEALARREDDTSEHPAGVAVTLGLAVSRLEATAPAAVALLRLLAVLAPEPVPVRLLLAGKQPARDLDPQVADALSPLLGDELARGNAIAALRRYSLVTPAGGGTLLMHRLVQVVTADQMTADMARAWRQAAAGLVEAAVPADPDLPHTWPLCAALLPHARAVLPGGSSGMARIVNYVGASGSYATARDQYAALLAVREKVFGAEHPDTLTARANLAFWTGQAGDPAAARDQYAALLPLREKVFGAEHPDTLTARANLASFTGQAGDPAAARDQYAALLPVIQKILGAQHPDTLTDRANLASFTGQAGDPAAARDQFAELLPVCERVLGPEHPQTLTARTSLARWTHQATVPGGPTCLASPYSPGN